MDSYSEPKLRSLISQLQSPENLDSEDRSLIIQIISLVTSMDLDSQPKPESKLISLVTQAISVFSSMDLDSHSRPVSDLVSFISEKISLLNSIDSYTEPKLRSLISQLIALEDTMESDLESDLESEFISLMIQIIYLVSSIDLDSQPKPESMLMSLVTQAISLFNSMDFDSQPKPLSELISLVTQKISLRISLASDLEPDSKFISLIEEILSLEPKPEPELTSVIDQVLSLFMSPDESNSNVDLESEPESDPESESESEPEPELKLISLITKLMSNDISSSLKDSVVLLSVQIISLAKSMDLDSLPKPETELMSLVTQTISIFSSIDLDSQPEPLPELISLINQNISLAKSPDWELQWKFSSLVTKTMSLEPESELISLIHQIFSIVISLNSKWAKLISFCPQVQLRIEEEGNFLEEIPLRSKNKWECLPGKWNIFSSNGEDNTHFFCEGCNGHNHEEYSKAPLEIKHTLHPKHSLQLVLLEGGYSGDLIYYCCDRFIEDAIYYCSACNFAICLACVEKPLLLSVDHPKWHEHNLAMFPTQASLTCNVCALSGSTSCPFYVCPPCDFVVHQSCINLPRVIRISRHLHRISFTYSFDQGDWSCGICRRKISNDYGGYSCNKEGCFYAAHSKCATQKNVWDRIDLEGVPEEIEEEVLEPYVRISDGIIQHFSHQHHQLRLDENKDRDYDENSMCQACITPIYFGNFYYCMQCEFILHETCAHLPRKIYCPIHPHLLTLVTDNDVIDATISCSACPRLCTGFFYQCDFKMCDFKLHVQCATISEPLVHDSHMDPLYLTSKPRERKRCGVCNNSTRLHVYAQHSSGDETFNCIECDFALCYGCATLPKKVRYRHDKHMLTLSYGEETSSMTNWCEACEGKVKPKKRFYRCDEYCCVTIHIECLVEMDLYMKPGLLLRLESGNGSRNRFGNRLVKVLPNNHRMRPFCRGCGDVKRCPYKYFFMFGKLVFCSMYCCWGYLCFYLEAAEKEPNEQRNRRIFELE